MKRKMFSVLNKILITALTAFLLLALFINASTLWSIREIKRGEYVKSGYFCVIIGSGSMKPTLLKNDLLLVKGEDSYQEGDIITYVSPRGSLITHRISKVTATGYIAQGDANNIPDDEIPKQRVLGKVVFVATGIGWIVEGVLSPVGIVLLACIFMLILVIQKMQDKTKTKENKMNTKRSVRRRKRRKILVIKRKKKKMSLQLQKAFSTFFVFGLFVLSLWMIQGTFGKFVYAGINSDSAIVAEFDVIITAPEGFGSGQGAKAFDYFFIDSTEVAVFDFQVYNGGETDVLCTPRVTNDVLYRVYISGTECTEFVVRTKETVVFKLLIGSEGLDVNLKDAELHIDIQQLEGV